MTKCQQSTKNCSKHLKKKKRLSTQVEVKYETEVKFETNEERVVVTDENEKRKSQSSETF